MTAQMLRMKYHRLWIIEAGAGGGWYAVRRRNLSEQVRARGLSMVRCGATTAELARNLEAESRLESTWRPEALYASAETEAR